MALPSQANQNGSQKKKTPIRRKSTTSELSSCNIYDKAENVRQNLRVLDIETSESLHVDFEHYRGVLQNKIVQQESQQARFLAVLDLLKINIRFLQKFKVVKLQKLLQENEGAPLKVFLETFHILERYASNLLKPEHSRHKSWRVINFRTDIYRKIELLKGASQILRSLGYIKNKLQEDGTVIGLTFPGTETVNESKVLDIATDISLAKFELETIEKGCHPRMNAIVNDDSFPRSLLPRSLLIKTRHRRASCPSQPLSLLSSVSSSKSFAYPSCKTATSAYKNENLEYKAVPQTDQELQNTYCHVCQKDCGEKVNFCQYCGTRVNVKQNLRKRNVGEHGWQPQVVVRSSNSPGMNEIAETNLTERDSSSVENGWLCENCTFVNSNMVSKICEMCYRTINKAIQ